MQVHTFVRPSAEGRRHWVFLCSDLHLGSPNVDLKRLKSDLDDARKAEARIVCNGDVFDAVDCRDKRFSPDAVVPELRASRTLAQDVVLYAAKILEPYADLFDVMGVGNHEEKWINWNAFDPVRSLIDVLNAGLEKRGDAHRVRHGGICGFVRTWLDIPEHKRRVPHTLLYFHGSGGDSTVTKGTIDYNRKAVQFDCDVMTSGHRHNRLFVDDVMVSLSGKGYVRHRERKAVMTGSYYQNYRRGRQSDPLAYSYATSKHHAPKPLGGMFLCLTPERDRVGKDGSSLWSVRQDIATSPLM